MRQLHDGRDVQVMEHFEKGLRCQDVHAGVHGVDPNSPRLIELEDTRLVGMAASLAATIRGQEVVDDAQALKKVAADQLDVDGFAFDQVVEVLTEADFVYGVKRKGGKIQSFAETVPHHSNLYERLGQVWEERRPGQVEEELIATVHRLARGPVPQEELVSEVDIEPGDASRVLELAYEAQLVKTIELPDGKVLYSPFFGFEHPEELASVMTEHGSERVQTEFAEAREYPGLPVVPGKHAALDDAIARGLVMAPSVQRPDKVEQAFAAIPYSIDRELFTVRRAVLNKALAVLACVRCGQHFGGFTAISSPVAILNRLLDPSRNHRIRAHSSAKRQYLPLWLVQIVAYDKSGNWVSPRLILTDDNIEAVELARQLLTYGEPVDPRSGESEDARQLLLSETPYVTPLQTMQRRRPKVRLSDREYEQAMDALMGRKAL